ncbi:M60 family metallopeptidase [Paenibacillus profundus]|uniref:M60 family metallopeptidase n=1 Tax=Paenibacillus profundus TaxID=1173085 RepID=A0ABS8YMA0_9BACL|nr:M60 family metallopeptidase [Paenibacillus profundus]MCE5171450.1 M60 family metallopeptidase [Paenibacillus profundus]
MKRVLEQTLQQDLALLYDGVTDIPVRNKVYGGVAAAVGGDAFTAAVDPDGLPVIAAARYGQGRILVSGVETGFNRRGGDVPGSGEFVANVLHWLTGESGRYRKTLAGQGPLRIITTASEEMFDVAGELPIEVTRVPSWAAAAAKLPEYAVAYADRSMKEDDLPCLDEYVQQGGSLLVHTKGWELEWEPSEEIQLLAGDRPVKVRDYPLQRLLNKAGISLGNNVIWELPQALPILTPEKANDSHVQRLIGQVKAIENGTLSIDDVSIGAADAAVKKKWSLLLGLIDGTVGSLTPECGLGLYHEIIAAAELVEMDITLPFEKERQPYTGVLLQYAFEQVSLDPDGVRSPYAEVFPGNVGDDAPVVHEQLVDVDFDYADLSYLRMLVPPGYWAGTGLYAPAGQRITIEVPDGVEHLDVQIGAHTDELGHLLTWERAPSVALRKPLAPGINQLSSPYGGLIYLIPTKAQADFKAQVAVSGAVHAPYFELGKTTVAEWQGTIRHYDAPYAELCGRKVILTLPSDVVRRVENPEELMLKWDDMIDQYDKFVGLGPDKPMPHRTPDRPHRIAADVQISAGYMHSGHPIMIPNEPAAEEAVTFDKFSSLKHGWGFWHEMGHEYQQLPWFWEDIVEVSVNIYSLLIQDYYGNPSRLTEERDKEGRSYFEKAMAFLNRIDGKQKFTDIGLFERLAMMRQLQFAYGWNMFTRLHIAYRELPKDQLPRTEQQKIDLFVEMVSRVCGDNLLEFFDRWGWDYSEHVRTTIDSLNLPQPNVPLWTLSE